MSRNEDKNPTELHELVKFVEGLKRQWMSTIDALVDPLMIVKTDYTIAKANLAMAKLAKKDIRNIIDQKCYKIFAGRDKPCDGCMMSQAAKVGKPKQFDLEVSLNDRFYEVTSQPIYDSDQKLTGIVQVYRDRTERKKMQAKLLQSEKLASIGLLAGGVAHEINNPLGGIMVFSQMVLREMPKDSPHYQDVEEILNATKRCKTIVENLLDFARTQPANRKKEELHEVNIKETLDTAMKFAVVSIKQHLFSIEEKWSDEDIVVKANRNKLIQLFLNLIQNAFQAMPNGGRLVLRAKVAGKGNKTQAIISVEDSGVGIPEENLKTIFDPFFTTKDPGEGTGLGLAICYGIMQEIGGEIKVESKINHGTTFSLVFPLKQKKLKKSA